MMTQRRQRIIDCAHRILGEGGTQSLTIDRLSREAEVAPRTLYRLFDDKEGVILATVSDRLREVRASIARRQRDYTIDVVFEELDWMVSEMHRDSEYARVVIGFYFSLEPRLAAIRELGSVAYNRFRNWMDREIVQRHTRDDLDLERIAQEFVATEFVVYHRWAVGAVDGDQCRIELHANFLKTACLVLNDPVRSSYIKMLTEKQALLALSAIGAKASNNRAERDAGDHFIGKA
ncbi:TetR/AcrR family transcriptional regulator [Sphingobium sp. SCG-1]|uniref:TetR/AcrR family transcriptional regulator n=1 Tax=Sphingobium sp. SCG-1 TaxID=2072936 RepID=UPI001CB8DF90|nr:TetR/AcrR family transcriptional regulator [Sphingobium sp. SCG-1]